MSVRYLVVCCILITLFTLGDTLLQRFFRYLKPKWNETLRDILAWTVSVTIVVTGVLLILKFWV